MLSASKIWQNVLLKHPSISTIFEKFEEDHEIKKLKLQNLNVTDIQVKLSSFQHKIQTSPKNWMENQYRVYMWYILIMSDIIQTHPRKFDSNVWEFVGAIFKKQPIDCQYFYKTCCKIKNEQWSLEEDSYISHFMKSSKLQNKWTEIGLEIFKISKQKYFRKPKAIRERWLSHINPSIIKKDWTLKEDHIMFEKVQEYGKKWSKIAKQLGNKSEHSVKNRYKKVLHYKCKENMLPEKQLTPDQEKEFIKAHKEEVYRKMHEEEIKIEEPSLFPLLKTKSKKKAERESEETEKQKQYCSEKEEKVIKQEAITNSIPSKAKIYYFEPIILTNYYQN